MARPFDVRVELETDAAPQQVWEAIATGRGMDGWFMGSSEVEPRQGGAAHTLLAGFSMDSTVAAWDPPHHFRTESGTGDDGRSMAFDFRIEPRGGGSVVHFVHEGFLPDDAWASELDALRQGDPMYLRKLGAYLKFFGGRVAAPVSAYGPQVDADRAWSVFRTALNLSPEAKLGDPVSARLEGIGPIDGVVDELSRDTLGVRTRDGLYRFIHGLGGSVVLGHHVYADVDRQATQQAWQAWLNGAFAA